MNAGDRAQSVQIGFAFVAVVVVAILANLLAPAMDQLHTVATDQTTNATAQTGLDWLKLSVDVLPFVALGVIVAGTIAASVFQSPGGRR